MTVKNKLWWRETLNVALLISIYFLTICAVIFALVSLLAALIPLIGPGAAIGTYLALWGAFNIFGNSLLINMGFRAEQWLKPSRVPYIPQLATEAGYDSVLAWAQDTNYFTSYLFFNINIQNQNFCDLARWAFKNKNHAVVQCLLEEPAYHNVLSWHRLIPPIESLSPEMRKTCIESCLNKPSHKLLTLFRCNTSFWPTFKNEFKNVLSEKSMMVGGRMEMLKSDNPRMNARVQEINALIKASNTQYDAKFKSNMEEILPNGMRDPLSIINAFLLPTAEQKDKSNTQDLPASPSP